MKLLVTACLMLFAQTIANEPVLGDTQSPIQAAPVSIPAPQFGEIAEVGQAAYYEPGIFKTVALHRHMTMRWDIGYFCAVRWMWRDTVGDIVRAYVNGGPVHSCQVLDVQNPIHSHGTTVIEVNYAWAAEAGFVGQGHAPAVIYLPAVKQGTGGYKAP